MYCPECGHDAQGEGRCPECGAGLAAVRSALTPGPAGLLTPGIIWAVFGGFAVAAVVLVVTLSGGVNAGSSGAAVAGSASTAPVSGATAGGYDSLVREGNALYDQGAAAFGQPAFEQGVRLFGEAAEAYAAAWKLKATDPNVGTDLATALFYGGDIASAIAQAAAVLEISPRFQPAHFNLGNFHAHRARIAERQGDAAAARAAYAEARRAYRRAVAVDAGSAVGERAAAALRELGD